MKQGTVGTYGSESLPNITGSAAGNRTPYAWYLCSGALYNGGDLTVSSNSYKAGLDTGLSGVSSNLKFDASKSSSVYKNNAKVNPDNAEVMYVIKF